MINRLIEPTSGDIFVDGKNNKDVDPIELRRSIGYVIQQTGLFPHMTVKENIEIIPKLMGRSQEEIDKKIYRLYENVGEEITLIERMKDAIAGRKDDENKIDDKTNDLISYYDLLSYLKHGIIFKKVSLNEFNKEIFYVYDNEGNYVIEDKTKVGNQFTTYLGEFDSDNNKFKKNIKIIEK